MIFFFINAFQKTPLLPILDREEGSNKMEPYQKETLRARGQYYSR